MLDYCKKRDPLKPVELFRHLDSDGNTPLHLAADQGNYDCIDVLISKDDSGFADEDSQFLIDTRDSDDNLALHLAIKNGEPESAELLLKLDRNRKKNITMKTQNNQELPLTLAASTELSVVKVLVNFTDSKSVELKKGSDGKGTTENLVSYAEIIDSDSKKLFSKRDLNRQNGDGNTPLSIAAENDKTKIVKYLLKQEGIEVNRPNFKDRTPYLLAAREGNSRVIKALIDYNKSLYEKIDKNDDVNSNSPIGVLFSVEDENDQTALHLIAQRVNEKDTDSVVREYVECARLILESFNSEQNYRVVLQKCHENRQNGINPC